MYALEITLVVVLLAFVAAQVLRRIPKRAALAIGGTGLLLIALAVALGQARLQMVPAYLSQPLEVPFLAMIHPNTEGVHAFAVRESESDFYALTVAGATHADFFDLTVLVPGMPGEVPGDRMVDIVNDVSLSFFDAYLRDGPKPRFDADLFPEVDVVMSERAREAAGE